MRNIALIFTVMFFMNSCMPYHESIPVIKTQDNIMFVEATVNGALTVPFLIDSGASVVSIPYPIFYSLVAAKTVEEGDMLPSKQYQLADGSVIECKRVMLRSFKIGNEVFYNVEATINLNTDAPCLMGQNILSKLKVVTFDYKKNKLYY